MMLLCIPLVIYSGDGKLDTHLGDRKNQATWTCYKEALVSVVQSYASHISNLTVGTDAVTSEIILFSPLTKKVVA